MEKSRDELPLVSIILPTFNRSHTIKSSIESILRQSYEYFELILIDDGSVDDTRNQIHDNFDDDRLIYVQRDHRGASVARNTGIGLARGEFIAFQDSDDVWMPEKLNSQIHVFRNNPEVDVVYSNMLHTSGQNTKMLVMPEVTKDTIIDKDNNDYLVYGIGIQTAMIKKACFEESGLFDEKLKRLIDMDLFIRFSLKYNFHLIEEPLVNYHFSSDGITSNYHLLIEARLYLLEKYSDLLIGNSSFIKKQYLIIAYAYRKLKDLNNSIKYFELANSKDN